MSVVKLDYDGIGEMLCSPGMQREMLRRAKKVKRRAEQIAPVSKQPDGETRGRYKDSFTASASVQRRKTKRAVGTVTSDDPAAFHIEFGTGDPTGARTPAHRTLGKALDAARD